MQVLSTTTANRNLFAGATCYTGTPDANNARLCFAMIKFGNGTNDLDGSGGTFNIVVSVGGQRWQADEDYLFGNSLRAAIQTFAFLVPANNTLTIDVTSPNAADTAVSVSVVLAADPLVRTELGMAAANLDTQLTALTTISTNVGLIKVVTDKVDTALESDGASGYQLTTIALENGPSANFTDVQIGEISTSVLSGLAGIQPVVLASFDPITYAIAITRGDDYDVDDERTIDIPITLPGGVVVANCTATFGAVRGADRVDALAELVEISGETNVRITLTRAMTQTISAGKYNWDAEVQHTDGGSVTSITVVRGLLTIYDSYARLASEL
jgi:hypothetical protein